MGELKVSRMGTHVVHPVAAVAIRPSLCHAATAKSTGGDFSQKISEPNPIPEANDKGTNQIF